MTYAISYCDCMSLAGREHAFQAEIESVYCGSYFCDQYFVNTPEKHWAAVQNQAQKHNAGMTLVIPMPGQAMLHELKKKALEIIEKYPISEIVVNDYGMYSWLSSRNTGFPIWFGRMLSKDIRDPRYTLSPSSIKLHERASQEGVMGLHPYGVEADLTEAVSHMEKTDLCRLALHTSLAYLTTGRICEFASIGTDICRKFRPAMQCKRQCEAYWTAYQRSGINYYKFGRAVYTPGLEIPVEWKHMPIRLIDNLLNWRISN